MKNKEILEFLNINSMNSSQKKAVFLKDMPILVSASAGSGKTFVLTRYLTKILTSSSPEIVNKILVLTFSKYAANEMFERINKKIYTINKKYPKNKNIKKIKNLISKKLITTIDSFCYNTLKENFQTLNISPNFKIISNVEIAPIKEEILNIIFEDEFKKNKEKFQNLSDYFSLKGETGLKDAILKIYEKSKTMPFPKEYISSIKKDYENRKNIEKKILEEIVNNIKYEIEKAINLLFSATFSLKEELIIKNFEPFLKETIFNLKKLKNTIKTVEYDDILKLLENFKFQTIPKYNAKKNPFNKTLAEKIKKIYIAPAKNIIKNLKENFITKNIFLYDFKKQKKIINYITFLTLKFYKKLEIVKNKKNILEFSDLYINTIKLTAKVSQKNNITLTPLGRKISSQFSEILVDEFQDINNSQNILIKILSNSFKNVFMVGDLKQSIYGFRDSDTKIFSNLIEKYSKNKKAGNLIYLNENFRSRKEITNSVNMLFSQIMSLNFGNVNYKETEQLVSNKKTKQDEQYSTELHILKNESEKENAEFELEHVAKTIKNMIDKKFKITDNNILRECAPKDFAVLFRSGKKNMQILCEHLEKLNINYVCHNNFDFMESYEISILISILKIINNPMLEIPLCAVAVSSMFSFSNEELLKIKIKNNNKNLFYCFKNSKNKKCIKFVNFIRKLIKHSTTVPIEELVEEIINSTYFLKIFPKLNKNINKIKNIEFFLEVARNYENFDEFGVLGFLEHLEKINSKNEEIKINENFNNKNAVNILTIHKSKGLEFPIVLLPLTSKNFNEEDFKSPILISQKYKLTLKHSSKKTLTRHNTLPFNAAVIFQRKTLKEEELRLLYVAMTRAKEKLILTATDNFNKFENVKTTKFKEFVLPYSYCSNKNSFYEWILLGFLRKEKFEFKNSNIDCKIIVKNEFEKINNVEKSYEIYKKTNINLEYNILKNKILYEKKHILTPIKISVTEIMQQKHEKSLNKQTLQMPNFNYSFKISALEKGIILHKFLQYANFYNAEKNLNLEIQQLVEKEFLTKKEAKNIDKEKLKLFFASKTYKIIKNGDKVEREMQFLCKIESEKIYNKVKNRKILMQGVVDCLVEKNNKLTLIDYKTDRLTENMLKKKYTPQLKYYKYAIEKTLKKQISSCLIYSIYLTKEIKIEDTLI